MRTLLPLLLALAPLAAHAKEGGGLVGSVEFQMGLGGATEVEPKEGDTVEADLATTFGITPVIEKMIGKNVGVGFEWMFLWVKGDEAPDDAERQMVHSPHVRLRMSFPIVDPITFDGMLGIGPTIWASNDDVDGPLGDTRFGWSLRFAFGVGYSINSSVAAFANLGYYTGTTYGDDLTAKMNFLPLSVGLRGSF